MEMTECSHLSHDNDESKGEKGNLLLCARWCTCAN